MPDIALPELPPMSSASSLPSVPAEIARPSVANAPEPISVSATLEPGLPRPEAPGTPPRVVEQQAVEHPPAVAEDLESVEQLVRNDPSVPDSETPALQMAVLATSEPQTGADVPVKGREAVAAKVSGQHGEIDDDVALRQSETLTPSQQLGKVRGELTTLAQQIQEGMTPENVRRYWDLKYQESQLVALKDATAVDLLRVPKIQDGQPQALDGQSIPEAMPAELPAVAQALNLLYDNMQRAMTPDDFRALMNTAGVAIERGNPPEQQTVEQQTTPLTYLKLVLRLVLGLLAATLMDKLGLTEQQVQQLTQNVDTAFTPSVGAEPAQVAAPASPPPISPAIATPTTSSA